MGLLEPAIEPSVVIHTVTHAPMAIAELYVYHKRCRKQPQQLSKKSWTTRSLNFHRFISQSLFFGYKEWHLMFYQRCAISQQDYHSWFRHAFIYRRVLRRLPWISYYLHDRLLFRLLSHFSWCIPWFNSISHSARSRSYDSIIARMNKSSCLISICRGKSSLTPNPSLCSSVSVKNEMNWLNSSMNYLWIVD